MTGLSVSYPAMWRGKPHAATPVYARVDTAVAWLRCTRQPYTPNATRSMPSAEANKILSFAHAQLLHDGRIRSHPSMNHLEIKASHGAEPCYDSASPESSSDGTVGVGCQFSITPPVLHCEL
jgi:hypothetical protein